MAGTNWRVVVLDSNQPKSLVQESWLDAQLASVGSRNLIVAWHHARWRNSGANGHNDQSVAPLMSKVYAAHADIVLWGHDHMYTRWAKMGPTGPAANGFRAFTVGTGGTPLVGQVTSSPFPGSQVDLRVHGVLELTLRSNDYSWRFVNTSGGVADSGTDTVTP